MIQFKKKLEVSLNIFNKFFFFSFDRDDFIKTIFQTNLLNLLTLNFESITNTSNIIPNLYFSDINRQYSQKYFPANLQPKFFESSAASFVNFLEDFSLAKSTSHLPIFINFKNESPWMKAKYFTELKTLDLLYFRYVHSFLQNTKLPPVVPDNQISLFFFNEKLASLRSEQFGLQTEKWKNFQLDVSRLGLGASPIFFPSFHFLGSMFLSTESKPNFSKVKLRLFQVTLNYPSYKEQNLVDIFKQNPEINELIEESQNNLVCYFPSFGVLSLWASYFEKILKKNNQEILTKSFQSITQNGFNLSYALLHNFGQSIKSSPRMLFFSDNLVDFYCLHLSSC